MSGFADLSHAQKAAVTLDVAAIRFFSHGGFLYFDEDRKCIEALAISSGTGFSFEPPQQWPAEYTETLHKEGRFEKVTIPELAAKGARLFAWIHAGEEIEGKNGRRQRFSKGAFVYLFHDDPHDWDGRDRFFEIDHGKSQAAVWYAQLHGSVLC